MPERFFFRLTSLWRRWRTRSKAPVVSVVRLAGIIGSRSGVRGGLSGALDLASVAEPLERAFSARRVNAVVLAINSPGGSPVQSDLIYRRIRTLAEEKKLPVFAFAEDVAASGGYMLACAGDEIYANESSVIGSVGVISAGFGFTGLLEKLGIERRVHAVGPDKGMLDPFRPENPADVERLTAIQKDLHEVFIALVRERRGERLKEGEDDPFSGAFWAGRRARDLGLVDGLADARSFMREKYGKDVRFLLVNRPRPWYQRLGQRLGLYSGASVSFDGLEGRGRAVLMDEVLSSLEAGRLWSRFGIWY